MNQSEILKEMLSFEDAFPASMQYYSVARAVVSLFLNISEESWRQDFLYGETLMSENIIRDVARKIAKYSKGQKVDLHPISDSIVEYLTHVVKLRAEDDIAD